jgi:hypothetical protein
MAHKFIAVHKSGGIEYATICTPKRVNGKKVNERTYLGRVINLSEGIFRNKSRGEFVFSIENGYSLPSETQSKSYEKALARGSLNLGHVYCVNKLLERSGLLNLIKETYDSDTFPALVMHRLLDCYADYHAKCFYDQTYTSLLYPRADLTSQGISRFLATIGTEAIRRDFHRRYISMIYPECKSAGILIDSTGLPNDINLFLTAISSHGGNVVNEIRLIYVVDRETMSPIYYRAIPGNVVDVVTLKGTIDELKTMNVAIDCSVLDAGYNSESNLEELYSLGINFMTRLISNRTLYKELLAKNCDTVMNPANRMVFNKRMLFMTTNRVLLPNNRVAYAYIGVDVAKKYEGLRNLGLREDPQKPMTDTEFDQKSKTAGMFIMISSIEMPKEEVLPYYYSRQTIEQIFDTSKNYARLLPLGLHNINTFNGHLLISFITTIIYLKLQKIFNSHPFNPIDFMTEMRGVTCGVYEDHLHIYELTSKQKKMLKILDMEIPMRISLSKDNDNLVTIH